MGWSVYILSSSSSLLLALDVVSALRLLDSVSSVSRAVSRLGRQFRLSILDWVLLSGNEKCSILLDSSFTFTGIIGRVGKIFSWRLNAEKSLNLNIKES